MFETLAKILNVKELKGRIVATALLLVVFRLGIYIPTPGIDYTEVKKMMEGAMAQGGAGASVARLADMFTGGALSSGSIFGLGIMPYITASIIFQLLVAIIPSLARLAHEGTTGRKKINQLTRLTTVGLCFIQGTMATSYLVTISQNDPSRSFIAEGVSIYGFYFYAIISLTVGTAFLMWLGEQIDEFGIGNGISLLIMAGIISRIPSLAMSMFGGTGGGMGYSPLMIVVILMLFVLMTLAVVMITLGTRRISLQASKATRGRKVYSGQRQFLPLKVNQSGVIPIIFAQAIMQFIAAAITHVSGYFGLQIGNLFSFGSFWYNAIYVVLIIFFCYFMTALMFQPSEMADNLKQSGMYLPGIRPGKRTAEYLEKIMGRIALAGAVFLAVIAVAPQIIAQVFQVQLNLAYLMGGTSLLIVVGVALDVVQRVESYLLMRDYEGFGVSGGRVRGRRR